jgi:hypothetical protein
MILVWSITVLGILRMRRVMMCPVLGTLRMRRVMMCPVLGTLRMRPGTALAWIPKPEFRQIAVGVGYARS